MNSKMYSHSHKMFNYYNVSESVFESMSLFALRTLDSTRHLASALPNCKSFVMVINQYNMIAVGSKIAVSLKGYEFNTPYLETFSKIEDLVEEIQIPADTDRQNPVSLLGLKKYNLIVVMTSLSEMQVTLDDVIDANSCFLVLFEKEEGLVNGAVHCLENYLKRYTNKSVRDKIRELTQ